ncbi:MAG: DUF4038 domain-containing protein [Sphingobacteriaceae bacterium]|nr:DUF4038 domain-containing protein [Sphingobacteriaceae bacterium]
MKRAIVLIFMVLVLFSVQGQVKVSKWQPQDFEFKNGAAEPANPYSVNFSADIVGPGGINLTLPGFYDSNNTWKIRFSPTKEGNWIIKTRSDVSGLNNQQVKVLCTKNKNKNVHGNVMVDNSKRHFIYEDGTHWFPNGYEANWLWALDPDDNSFPTMNPFLDKLKTYGFNFILINAYGYDTTWKLGKSEAEDYGPSPLYPWAGSNDKPDFTRFNLAYWQHFDKMIESMYQRDIRAHIYIKVYNKKVNWMKNDSPEDDMYHRWLIARYAAYPNITWDLAKEANYEKSVEYKVNRLKFIRATDPYKRPLTVHTDIQTYDKGFYNGLVDFRAHQEQSKHLHATTLKQLAQNEWPVFNVESGYEWGPKGATDRTYKMVHSPEETVKFIWEVQMAGGYNAYYYTYTAWDVMRIKETPPGYSYLKNFYNFFQKTSYWLLKPSDSLVDKGFCLANAGKEYIVYQYEPKPFTLKLEGLIKPIKAKWYQPLTGKYLDAGKVANGSITLTPPSAFNSGPVVLHVGGN